MELAAIIIVFMKLNLQHFFPVKAIKLSFAENMEQLMADLLVVLLLRLITTVSLVTIYCGSFVALNNQAH